jgi:hypothetical protein
VPEQYLDTVAKVRTTFLQMFEAVEVSAEDYNTVAE